METLFTTIYTLEVVVKVAVFGWKAYAESKKNVFDFSITMMAIASTAIVYYPNKVNDSRLIRMVFMARVLRLLRLLMTRERFEMIAKISSHILPAASSVILVLFALMYLFAAHGPCRICCSVRILRTMSVGRTTLTA